MKYKNNLEQDSLITVYNGSMAQLNKMDGIEHILLMVFLKYFSI